MFKCANDLQYFEMKLNAPAYVFINDDYTRQVENPLRSRSESGIMGSTNNYREIVFQIQSDNKSVMPSNIDDQINSIAIAHVSDKQSPDGKSKVLIIENIISGNQSVDDTDWLSPVMKLLVLKAKNDNYQNIELMQSFELLSYYNHHQVFTGVDYFKNKNAYALYLRSSDGAQNMPELDIYPHRLKLFLGDELAQKVINGYSNSVNSFYGEYKSIRGLNVHPHEVKEIDQYYQVDLPQSLISAKKFHGMSNEIFLTEKMNKKLLTEARRRLTASAYF